MPDDFPEDDFPDDDEYPYFDEPGDVDDYDRWRDRGWRPEYPDVMDPDLVWLLRNAMYDWYRVDHPTELRAQLEWILRHTEEGRAGRPADAIGVTAGTWNRWTAWAIGLRDRRTGQRLGNAPSPASREKIERRLAGVRRRDRPTPTRCVLRGVIVWAGYQNGRAGRGGKPDMVEVRQTTLDGLDLGAATRAWERFDDWAAAQAFCRAVYDRYGEWVDFYVPDTPDYSLELKS